MAEMLGTVHRALRVLDYLADIEAPVPIKRLAADLEINLSSAYHVLNTLVADGYAARDGAAGGYALGAKAAKLGPAYERRWPALGGLREIVRALSEQLDENAYLAVVHGHDVVIAAVAESQQRVRLRSLAPGITGDLHARALGKVVLAFRDPADVRAYFATHPPHAYTPRSLTEISQIEMELARVRLRGYAEDLEEYSEGVCCVAAPIFSANDAMYGALSASIPAFRYRAAGDAAREAVTRYAATATALLRSACGAEC